MFTYYDRQIVIETYTHIEPICPQLALLFYNRLVAIAPETRHLFICDDMEAQGQRLMAMFGTIVKSLDDMYTLLEIVTLLAERHISYGMRVEHYDAAGVALLWTLEQGLGDAFTDDVQDAWANLYALMAETAKAVYVREGVR